MGRPRHVCLAPVLLLALAPAAAQSAQESAPPSELVGAPAAFGADAASEERILVPEGAPLRELPDARSAALAIVDAPIELPAIERQGRWVRVRYGGLMGWVAPDGDPPLGLEAGAPSAPPAAFGAERRREALDAAQARLGTAGAGRLGPWVLFTDVQDAGLLAYLARVAEHLPELYRERYRLEPGRSDGDVVLLFAEEGAYRSFAAQRAGLLGVGEGGYAGLGLAALHAGARDRGELASLLVHELTHLLNARALGTRTPPWIEEGLADDLAFAEIGPGGRLDPGTVGGAERHEASLTPSRELMIRASWEGGKGALVSLVRRVRAGDLPSVEGVAQASWRALADPDRRALLYAESTFFVRYLLAEHGDGFRRYLRELAAGGLGDPAALIEALGLEWADLDAEFRRWLPREAERLGLVVPP